MHAKVTHEKMTTGVRTMGIIGAGEMGTDIAQVCCLADFQVVLTDLSQEKTTAALASIADNLARSVSKGTLTESRPLPSNSHIGAATHGATVRQRPGRRTGEAPSEAKTVAFQARARRIRGRAARSAAGEIDSLLHLKHH
jgi:3-hydroxyacyl-CoA dehydrogenase, NAD binding domain